MIRRALLLSLLLALGMLLAACPKRVDPEGVGDAGAGVDAGLPDGAGESGDSVEPDAGARTQRPLQPEPRPQFGPDSPPPCESHTACYLAAKRAHATGEDAGFRLAIRQCEYYRGRYQLEQFYGLCLLILANAYGHLDNFDESQECLDRLLESGGDEQLMMEAQRGLDLLKKGRTQPLAFRDYLDAVALVLQFAQDSKPEHLDRADALLVDIQRRHPEWALKDKVRELRRGIAAARREP